MAEHFDEDKTVFYAGDDSSAANQPPAAQPDVLEDPDATQFFDEAPTSVGEGVHAHFASEASAAGDADAYDPDATVVDPGLDRTVAVEGPDAFDAYDGIGAMDGYDDDPYFYAAPLISDPVNVQAPVSIESPVKSYPERKKRMPRWAVVLIVIALVAAAAGAAYYTYDQELWGGKTVPDVVGLSEEDAIETLQALGFDVDVEYQTGDENIGYVLECNLTAGERLDPDEMDAVITVAAERVLPSVVGLDVEAAQDELADAGATNVVVEYELSDEDEGTVLSISPEEGSAFVSTDQITLSVAEPYTVPDIMGLTLEEAEAILDEAGLIGNFTYVDSDEEEDTVVAVEPGVGEELKSSSVIEVSVASPYPSSVYSLFELCDTDPEKVATYLAKEDFSLIYGAVYSNGRAHAVYKNASGDLLHFTDYPEIGTYSTDKTSDVLANGRDFDGIRLDFSSSTAPSTSITTDGVKAVMSTCGFSNAKETCTQSDLVAAGLVSEDAGISFICTYGTSGSYSWAVIISNDGSSTQVTALITPTSRFTSADLSAYGGYASYYLALVNLYQ